MSIQKSKFGTLPDGNDVFEFTLKNSNGMLVKVINYGGIITSIVTPDKFGNMGDVVLGFDSLDYYIQDTHYIGAIVGRTANRIANAQFSLDIKTYTLATNNGTNNHHGGLIGFNKKYWHIKSFESQLGEAIQLEYLSKDGEEGFPGNLQVVVIYTLTEENSLIVDYKATTDKKTVINLTQHSYFNLSAGKQKDILSHDLQIFANNYLPGDLEQIPTGEIENVLNTPFDFTKTKTIGKDIDDNNAQIKAGAGFDHTWVIEKESRNSLDIAAKLVDSESGRTLEIYTTEPGIQFYSGNYLNGQGVGKAGEIYNYRYGMGLETQHFPDSPNKPNFPSVTLNVGEEFKSTTKYVFKTE
jgi:aldose 1-epimerase